MMITKYKIGNFTVEIKSQAIYENTEPFSLFMYDGEDADYRIDVRFSASLPQVSEASCHDFDDRVCDNENGAFRCFYKSRDNEDEFYACRIVSGKDITVIIDDKYREMVRADVIFTLIGIEEIAVGSNGCVLHSSFAEKDGGAILFTGPCDIGKSTQANLWRKYADAVVVNGDKTYIFEKDGVFYASGLPFSGSSRDCLNRIVPLRAVISLAQAKTNTAEKVASTEAFFKVYKNCYPVSSSGELTGMLFDFVQRFSQSVPIYEYACLPDESAVRYLERELCPHFQSL